MMERVKVKKEYRVEFILEFVGEENTPMHDVRMVNTDQLANKEAFEKELQRYFAGINEIPLGKVAINVLKFEQL